MLRLLESVEPARDVGDVHAHIALSVSRGELLKLLHAGKMDKDLRRAVHTMTDT